MKADTRLAATVVSTVMLMLAVAMPAHAATVVKSPPYTSDGMSQACKVLYGAYCVNSSSASRADGSISVDSSVHAPAMTDGVGMSRSDGKVSTTFKPQTWARKIEAVATIRIDSASAEAVGLLSDGFAHVVAEATLNVACGNCPGGSVTTSTLMTIADTDLTTAAPSSVNKSALTVPVSVQFAIGQKVGTTGAVVVRVYARGTLDSHLHEPIEEVARASGLVTVPTIKLTY